MPLHTEEKMKTKHEIMEVLDSVESSFASKDISDKIQFFLDCDIHKFPLMELKAKDYLDIISSLAQICPSTALSFSMHLYTVWGLNCFNKNLLDQHLNTAGKDKILFGSLNEPGLYFVNAMNIRKEEFALKATKVQGGYIVNGVKKFVSLEPFVRYLPVYGLVDNYTGSQLGVIALIIDKQAKGVTVVKDWDSIAMSATHSNSVEFENVFVPDESVICSEEEDIMNLDAQGYLFRFNVSCVYYGIAKQTVDYVVKNCKKRKVPQTNKALAYFPGVQFTLAEMLILLETSASQLQRCCEVIDQFLDDKDSVKQSIHSVTLMTKEYITRSADEIVSKAMKIEGIQSLSNNNPLSSFYKDVKAGRFHPPQQDLTYELLAKERLGIISYKHRWL